MQITHFNTVCVPVSTGTLKGDKLFKMPSNSISGGVNFQNFLGACPQTPSVSVLHMPVVGLH